MAVIKRSKENSVSNLDVAMTKFVAALSTQGEDDAISDLENAMKVVKSAALGTAEFQKGVADIKDAFEEHELDAYTFKPKSKEGEWSIAEELYVTSTQVLSILKRFGV